MAAIPFAIYNIWVLSPAVLGGKLFLTAVFLFGLFMAYCMVAAPFRQRVILGDSAIEVVNLFGTQRIAYADLAAKVRLPANYPMWALVSADGSRGPVKFDMGYSFDQSFRDWLAAIPEGELNLLRRPHR